MSKHILILDVPVSWNPSVILLRDLSTYTSSIPIQCPELQILPPGYSTPAVIEVQSKFDLVLNACTCGILPVTGCAQGCPILPDGIWWFRYSVAPGEQVYVEYNYLRIVRAWNRLNEVLCKLPLDCTLPSQELQYDIDNISRIREYLIAAQTYVNEFNQPEKGIAIYQFANQLIDKMQYHPNNCRIY